MPRQPRKNFLRRIGGHEYVCRPRKRHPLADVRSKRIGLPFSAGLLRVSLFLRGVCSTGPGCGEAQAFQDAARLMRREVRAVEPCRAREYLLGREASPMHHDVVLPHGIREVILEAALDPFVLEIELLAGNGESWHVPNCIL